jgi:hypothetical protein
MTTYIVYINRKKRPNETLNDYYQAITLGTVDASNAPQGLKLGAQTFRRNQGTLDVVAVRRATPTWQKVIGGSRKR